ncbi:MULTISPECIES: hypothetical protein [unclassified Mesorhizobium]|uniref:hypothetical protein n=1 Tax=unclassified Mesorhizobium TaxID=325217 RepID=UPI00112DDDC6|nr:MULTISPECIES: hypothetical protein [unclassified Mesorhizobium]TPK59065.1 hypothetical protein FJ551_25995 [Mesorhizobium sp. B2-5-1]TPL06654.1 hypothetical protein FJ944_22750 [Mesorhizobium sp. B2-4-11]
MNTHSLDLTRDGLISALSPKPGLHKPEFLRDVIAMKKARGDTDIADFTMVCREFGSGTNATVGGAAWAMRQWVAKRKTWISEAQHARRIAFLADLDAVIAGTFGVEFKAVA